MGRWTVQHVGVGGWMNYVTALPQAMRPWGLIQVPVDIVSLIDVI